LIDHDTGRLVWAPEGRDANVVPAFLDDLGPERARLLTHVSADGAEWIHGPFRARARRRSSAWTPSTSSPGRPRRQTRSAAGWPPLRRDGKADQASTIKHTRWALIKNPESQTPQQRGRLAQIARTNKPLYRAYLIKEQLREAFKARGEHGKKLLAGVLAWCARSGLASSSSPGSPGPASRPHPGDVRPWAVQRQVRGHQHPPARTDQTGIRLPQPQALIAHAMLARGGLCPDLPGRAA